MKLSVISDECWYGDCKKCNVNDCAHYCHKEHLVYLHEQLQTTVTSDDKWFDISEDTMADLHRERGQGVS